MFSNRALSSIKFCLSHFHKTPFISTSTTTQICRTLSKRNYANYPPKKPNNFRNIALSMFGGGSLLAAGLLTTKDRNKLTPAEEKVPIKDSQPLKDLPIVEADVTLAPHVPPPIQRNYPVGSFLTTLGVIQILRNHVGGVGSVLLIKIDYVSAFLMITLGGKSLKS
jgi:hypothetical protein